MEYKNNDAMDICGKGVEWYREKIVEIANNIEDIKLLKRIYDLAEYLYIYK